MTNSPPLSLSGLWMFDGQTEQLDAALGRFGDADPERSAAPHGTYTRICYYRIVMDERPGQGEARPSRTPC